MSSESSPLDDKAVHLHKCQQGNPEALADLRAECHRGLLRILLARGARPTEAEDVLADIWADCVPGPGERPSLLEKFRGRSRLQTWLATVATNRWLDSKRRQGRILSFPPDSIESASNDPLSESSDHSIEEPLISVLRESLQAAFAFAPPQTLVLLRLVYIHGLSQREVGRMLGWAESRTSRTLSAALKQIETDALRELRKRDAWLELTWQDFLDLCETHKSDFL